LPEENEEIVAAFLQERSEFKALHCGELLGEQGIPIATGGYLRLWPHLHGTDGFFAAVIEKSS
jgi:16S rRNA (cytosine967-C5)-methyltransferase